MATEKGILAPHTKTMHSMFDNADITIDKSKNRPVEVALIRRWARRVAGLKSGGKGTFDVTLPVDIAAGLMVSSTYRKIAYSAINSSTNAVIYAVHKNGFRFSL